MASTGKKEEWPNVQDKLGLRRFSLLRHLIVTMVFAPVMIVAMLIGPTVAVPSTADAIVSAAAEVVEPRTRATWARAQTVTKPRPSDYSIRDIVDAIVVGLMFAPIVGIAFWDVGSHYQMRTAIHNHHAEIDKIVIPERTKCRGDSTNDTDDGKKYMTDILETHQIRDFKDTHALLIRQGQCATVSILTFLLLSLVVLPYSTDHRNFSLLAILLTFTLIMKLLIVAVGIRSSLAERRVFPWGQSSSQEADASSRR